MAGSRKDVRLRLRNAALELYAERGFDRTTAAEIATRANVTERTYFRHFADKREVLFDGEANLQTALLDAVAGAPDSPPLALLQAAFVSVVPLFESERALKRRRDQVVAASPALRERAVMKLAHLTEVIAGALERRGVPGPMAALAASCGMGVLTRVRIDWLAGSPLGYEALLTHAFADLTLLLERDAPGSVQGLRTT